MTTDHIIIIILAVLLLAERLTYLLASRSWARERRELCNRIQAGTLADYAAHKELVENVPVDRRKSTAVGLGDEGYEAESETGALSGLLESVEVDPRRIADAQADIHNLVP